tara:strand:- start:1559 stop:1756 length:198 start_codon:yes stop_codon:yes gene_type:complete
MSFFPLFIISVFFLILVFIGIGIKILIKKDGTFSGTCASQNPLLNQEGEVCGYCGKPPTDCEETN